MSNNVPNTNISIKDDLHIKWIEANGHELIGVSETTGPYKMSDLRGALFTDGSTISPSGAIKIADIIRKFDILRLKGFIAVEGKPMRMTIQAVGPRVDTYFDQPFGLTPRQTKIVVIGQAGLNQAAIISALTK